MRQPRQAGGRAGTAPCKPPAARCSPGLRHAGRPASRAVSVRATGSPADRPALERAHPAPAADQIGTAVARASKDGRTEIHVRLDPVELGRVEVRLHFQADGEVRAQVTTDNPQTFDLLRRDSQSLERALQDAGIKTDSGSLSFNLRQQDHQAGQQELAKNHRGGNDSGASGRSDRLR
ncbi:flagellar hook-length control protein FliK [Hankyongella ginsenosidimutans]|uniref:flagellar hook-length control protein FliK n=1 Tax=Hankyongella ginsenosidimutans TaxID=1763828 RepID=UPI0024829CFD|nr:flagellar hook-length control protein FliK [Hankyongella ginsenosidimutans]